ncbi:MAG: hypothetical protein AABZ47_04390, partial [Planctomycetota bacterium]
MQTRNIAFCLPFVIGLSIAKADPTINVTWSEVLPPVPGQNYTVSTIAPASPAFPNVVLQTGSPTWQVWSLDLDADAGDGIGDIGVISSPADDNFTVKLAAPGSPDKLMIFWGPYIDLDWDDYYIVMFNELKAAGFTHVGLQIWEAPTSPTDERWATINDRVQQIRTLVGLPLAFFEVPGKKYLKDRNSSSGEMHTSNGKDIKYFDTVSLAENGQGLPLFDPFVWKDTNYCCEDFHLCIPSAGFDPCLDECCDPCGDRRCNAECDSFCDNNGTCDDPSGITGACVPCEHCSPHTTAHDPKYTGSLWDEELEWLGDSLDPLGLQPDDLIVLDLEIYAHPDAVQNYYSNVIENSPGRYNDIDYPTQAAQFNEYRTQWNARVQNLVNKCANPMTGCPDCQVIFYSKDLWAGQSHLNLLADDLQEVIR